jgi:hypothetical protein
VSKRPGPRTGVKQLVIARQLVRKLRAIRRATTRNLRRRLLRSKRRYYRKPRTRFTIIRYTRRLRVKRRVRRRVRRYIRSTTTILRGSRARTLSRRAVSRQQRAIYLQISQRSRLLLQNPTTTPQQTKRQQLFTLKEQRRRLRALRLLTRRATPLHRTTSSNGLRTRRTIARLRRRLASYTATLTPRLPRPRVNFAPHPLRLSSIPPH